jgi:hypothetical protein
MGDPIVYDLKAVNRLLHAALAELRTLSGRVEGLERGRESMQKRRQRPEVAPVNDVFVMLDD